MELTEGQIRYRKYRNTYKKYSENNCKKYNSIDRFGGMSEKVFKKYQNKCDLCGMTNEEHNKKYNRDLTIHHIDGSGRNSLIKNNKLNNLQLLCLRCHGYIDKVRSLKRRQQL